MIQGNNSFNPNKNQNIFSFNNSPDFKNQKEKLMKPPVAKNTSSAKTLSYKNLNNQPINTLNMNEGLNYQNLTHKAFNNTNSSNMINQVSNSLQNQQFYTNQFNPYNQFNQQYNQGYIPQQPPIDMKYNYACNSTNQIRPNFNNLNSINSYYQQPQYNNYNPYFPQKEQMFMMNNIYQNQYNNQNNQNYTSQTTYPQVNFPSQYMNHRENK
jgi:hypothetical protein